MSLTAIYKDDFHRSLTTIFLFASIFIQAVYASRKNGTEKIKSIHGKCQKLWIVCQSFNKNE